VGGAEAKEEPRQGAPGAARRGPQGHRGGGAAEAAALEAEEKAIGPRIEALLAEWEAIEKEIAWAAVTE
jgi:hypothetical protein